ncbi:MAG: hypothetical protein CMP08_00380 [Xanthomonadales bacterium]|nr:hypothetical protein [Xanthomonadales bacterium]
MGKGHEGVCLKRQRQSATAFAPVDLAGTERGPRCGDISGRAGRLGRQRHEQARFFKAFAYRRTAIRRVCTGLVVVGRIHGSAGIDIGIGSEDMAGRPAQ